MLSTLKRRLTALRDNPRAAISTSLVVTAVGLATRRAAAGAWHALHGQAPPRDPARPEVTWPQALAWTTAVGVTVGLARIVTRRALHARS